MKLDGTIFTYYNIPIIPFSELLDRQNGLSAHKGGPIWPDWQQAAKDGVRHIRCNRAVDEKPVPPRKTPSLIETPLFWCGPLANHYGHMIADFMSRLPFYLEMNRDGLFCFAVHPRSRIRTLADAPVFFREIIEWYGIPENKICIINKPVLAKTLIVCPQHEPMGQAPTKEFLTLLEHISSKNGLTATSKQGSYYVSRSAIPRGKIAGESYLESVLVRAGVNVIRPETLPLQEQLRIYASAEKLIFSEGSALHSLQLLGRSVGEVTVLLRRKDSKLAHKSIKPRAKKLSYQYIGPDVQGLAPLGGRSTSQNICIPDDRLLLSTLRELGISLETLWSRRAFVAAIKEDVRLWLRFIDSKNRMPEAKFRREKKEVTTEVHRLVTKSYPPFGISGLGKVFSTFTSPRL